MSERACLAGVEAVLFDFDGTLVEPSIDFGLMRRAVVEAARAVGIDDPNLERMYVLEVVEHVRALLNQEEAGRGDAFAVTAARVIEDVEVEAARRVLPYAGVPTFLEELASRGLGVAIVTRNCRRAVEAILQRIPLHHDVLLTRDDVKHVKPDPRHLLAALDLLGVDGAHAVMCGDHPMDITVGKKIGARTAGVLQPGFSPEYFAEVQPDVVLERVTDLAGWLDGAECTCHPDP